MRVFLVSCIVLMLSAIVCRAETQIERGAYLVTTIGACGNCHSPVDQNRNRNGPALSGGPAILAPVSIAYPPNITPDVDTGIGAWSEDQIVDALRNGRRPDGRILRPPMPVPFYRALSDVDVHAIATYLKSLPSTVNRVSASTYHMPTPASYGPPIVSVPNPDQTGPVAYGAYLASLGHCMLCHTPSGPDGKRDYAHRLGAGGFPVETANGIRISANITPDLKPASVHGPIPRSRQHLPMASPPMSRLWQRSCRGPTSKARSPRMSRRS